jgi:hypothetical protein
MDDPAGTSVERRRTSAGARRLRFAAQRALLLRPRDVIAQSDDRDLINSGSQMGRPNMASDLRKCAGQDSNLRPAA